MRIIRLFFNYLYWKIYNRRNQTQVLNFFTPKSIRIGKHVMIRNNTEIGKDVSIGDYSYISGPINYIESAVIGKFCSIARQCVIGVSSHNYNWVTTHPIIVSSNYGITDFEKAEPQKEAPIIGNDVWIGINCIIHRGITIGDGAVVAAGSVVTRNVEPYSIVAGVPAKHIKYRFTEANVKGLLKIKWWDFEDEKLKEASESMYDIEDFIRKFSSES